MARALSQCFLQTTTRKSAAQGERRSVVVTGWKRDCSDEAPGRTAVMGRRPVGQQRCHRKLYSGVCGLGQARGAGSRHADVVAGEEGVGDVLDDEEEELESVEGGTEGLRVSPAGQQTR